MSQLPKTATAGHPHRILLAEDDLEMRRLLRWSLEHSGLDVVECPDGVTLLRKLSEHGRTDAPEAYDLVISDIRMPGYTGLDVLASVCEFDDCPPVVLISAFADHTARERAEELGAAALLPKPFDVSELVALVEEILPDGAVTATATAAEPEGDHAGSEPEPDFPLEVEFRHGEVRAPVEDFVRQLASKLDRRDGAIQRCRVVIDAFLHSEDRHHWYTVKAIVRTRDAGTIVVERRSSPGHSEESLYLSLQMIFAAVHRRLEKKRARRRTRARRHDHADLAITAGD
jgi:CheY-like chemotaxis protein